jgi:hypothetical protein
VNSAAALPSLIHYLDSNDAEFYLKLSLNNLSGSATDEFHSPFLAIDEFDPLASIVEASVVSNAGSKIKNVFLLIQKDHYHLPKDGVWPANNRDVEQAWQSLFSFLTASREHDSIIILKDQFGDNGKLLPWQSLFYCKHRQVFFHPSCPQCGSSIRICDDEDLLSGMGLQPYSGSLKRYLFCPHCLTNEGESGFYKHSLDGSDPEIVKDHKDLIRGFGQLARIEPEHTSIPCIGCAYFQECYETQQLATTRIAPVCFYPFFMMVLDAPSIHVHEFLPLLAGASVNDVADRLDASGQMGRLQLLRRLEERNPQKSLFPFDKQGHAFLEVLHLKLSLLGEMARVVFSGLERFTYPDLSLSIDKFWVAVAGQSNMLPTLWNFKLNLMGIGADSTQAFLEGKSSPSYGLSFLGFNWFCVLLANSKQDFCKIHGEIANVIENLPSEDDFRPGLAARIRDLPISSPESIYWKTVQSAFDQSSEALWVRSLELGSLLIQGSMNEASRFSQTEFWQEYEKLRTDLSKALFMPGSAGVSASPSDDNKVIHEILMNIAAKWQSTIQSPPSGAGETPADLPMEDRKVVQALVDLPENLVIKETVILSADDFTEKPPSSVVEEDHVPETVVAKAADATPAETAAPASQPAEDIPETVVFAHGTPKEETPSPIEPRENDIPQTAIMAPKEASASSSSSEEKRPADAGNSERTEQSIPNASGETPVEKAQPGAKEKDEDIPETVIFDPTKKGGKQKHGD